MVIWYIFVCVKNLWKGTNMLVHLVFGCFYVTQEKSMWLTPYYYMLLSSIRLSTQKHLVTKWQQLLNFKILTFKLKTQILLNGLTTFICCNWIIQLYIPLIKLICKMRRFKLYMIQMRITMSEIYLDLPTLLFFNLSIFQYLNI